VLEVYAAEKRWSETGKAIALAEFKEEHLAALRARVVDRVYSRHVTSLQAQVEAASEQLHMFAERLAEAEMAQETKWKEAAAR
jgi:hypothetical protein